MNSGIDEYLDEVDQWKRRVHEKLKRLAPKQRAAFWKRAAQKARHIGLRVVQPKEQHEAVPARTRHTG